MSALSTTRFTFSFSLTCHASSGVAHGRKKTNDTILPSAALVLHEIDVVYRVALLNRECFACIILLAAVVQISVATGLGYLNLYCPCYMFEPLKRGDAVVVHRPSLFNRHLLALGVVRSPMLRCNSFHFKIPCGMLRT